MKKMNIYLSAGLLGLTSIKIILDNFVYDEEGYNKNEFNRQGFNKSGYDKNGFDGLGYNSKGYNKKGYNLEGYNNDGFDKNGFDCEGYNKKSLNRDGYNRDGYNLKGFDRTGFNWHGIDPNGYNREYYNNLILEMKNLENKSKLQMDLQEFPYALRDIRVGIEIGLKCLLVHYKGKECYSSNLSKDIDACKNYNLISDELKNKLYGTKMHCNDTLHFNDKPEKIHEQVYFAHKTFGELIKMIVEFSKGNHKTEE